MCEYYDFVGNRIPGLSFSGVSGVIFLTVDSEYLFTRGETNVEFPQSEPRPIKREVYDFYPSRPMMRRLRRRRWIVFVGLMLLLLGIQSLFFVLLIDNGVIFTVTKSPDSSHAQNDETQNHVR